MSPRQLASSLFFVCQLLGSIQMVSAQDPIDPQSLIGEWVGKWSVATGTGGRGGAQGPYTLTVTKVEGGRVSATFEIQGRSRDITATLAGNRLTFGNEQFQTQLTVQGNEMRGTRQGGGNPTREIQLLKK